MKGYLICESSVEGANVDTLQKFVICRFREVEVGENGLPIIFEGDHLLKNDKSASRVYNEGKGVKVGKFIKGEIREFKTTPYEITGDNGKSNTVNKTTVVVFGDDVPLDVANTQLARHNACVLNEKGEPTVDLKAKPAGQPKLAPEVKAPGA